MFSEREGGRAKEEFCEGLILRDGRQGTEQLRSAAGDKYRIHLFFLSTRQNVCCCCRSPATGLLMCASRKSLSLRE